MKKLPARKLLLALAIAAAAALLAAVGLSFSWHGDRLPGTPRVLSSARGNGPLRAAAAAVNFDLPPATPIGGFARGAYASEGVRDPVGAHALFLEAPGARVAVVSLELLLVTEPLRHRVEALVADLRLDALLVAATHTHAGPGGFDDVLAFELGALGRHDPAVFERIATAAAAAVRQAVAAATPARLSVARGGAPSLVWARSGGTVDGRMLSLRLASAGGEPLAELLVFAAHPTLLGKQNRRLSGDWPGRFLTAPGRGVRLLLQGAIGDQSAEAPPGDAATIVERYAGAVAAADDALVASPPMAEATLAAASVEVTLPRPAPGAVPPLLRRAAATLAWNQLPATARITALRVGPALLVATPAEPTSVVAERWRSLAPDAAIVSLADGYIGYAEDAERIRRGEGEAVRSYYGPELAERLEAGIAAALRAANP